MFPESALDELEISLGTYMGDYTVVRRGPRPTDPALTIGLRAGSWSPVEGSHEISASEPTLNRYNYEVELLVKHADEVSGRALYTEGAKKLRAVLYRDPELRLRWAALSEDLLGSTERFKRMRVEGQTFLKNDIKGSWYFVAATRFSIETETAPTVP